MGKKVTETTTIRGALIMPYPSALGPADEPLTIEWPEGHSYAVVATAFHGGAVLGTMATEDEAWEIYDQWPKTDCRCGCRGIVTRDGLRLRRGGSPQKILDDWPYSFDPQHLCAAPGDRAIRFDHGKTARPPSGGADS